MARNRLYLALPTGPCVYRIYDADDVVIYVGKANNLGARLGNHYNGNSLWLSTMAYLEWDEVENSAAALKLERRLIQLLQPRYNTQGRTVWTLELDQPLPPRWHQVRDCRCDNCRRSRFETARARR